MKKLSTVLAALAVLVLSGSLAHAAQAPDFAAIAEALNNGTLASEPVVQEIDFSKVETSTMAYIAAVARQAEHPTIPFNKLAQQFIWGGERPRFHAGDSLERDFQGDQRPYIMVGGYWDTQISSAAGGRVTLLCYVSDPQGPGNIAQVELYFNQRPTGVTLFDDGRHGDFAANDSVFGIQFDIDPGSLPAGQYLLELVATDRDGNQSDMWPYLTIN
jgi:hypothetical protein